MSEPSMKIRERMTHLASLAQQYGLDGQDAVLWQAAVEGAIEEILERLDRLEEA